MGVQLVKIIGGGTGGSDVQFIQGMTAGDVSGQLVIDGTTKSIYCNSATSVSYAPTKTSGDACGVLNINGATSTIFCNTAGGGEAIDFTFETLSASAPSISYTAGTNIHYIVPTDLASAQTVYFSFASQRTATSLVTGWVLFSNRSSYTVQLTELDYGWNIGDVASGKTVLLRTFDFGQMPGCPAPYHIMVAKMCEFYGGGWV